MIPIEPPKDDILVVNVTVPGAGSTTFHLDPDRRVDRHRMGDYEVHASRYEFDADGNFIPAVSVSVLYA